MSASVRIPRATYRIQFGAHFGFREAAALAPYLASLGVSDLYASPLLAARSGSTHGYDVVDPTRWDPRLGAEPDFEAMVAALRAYDLGLLLDVVPNHMGIHDEANTWWWDVLENGPSSPHARFFDIDWQPDQSSLQEKVLLPVLGAQYGRVLESGELRVEEAGGAFAVAYYDKRFPLAPRTWNVVLEGLHARLLANRPVDSPEVVELESIMTSLRNLPPRSEADPERRRERLREKEVARRRIAELLTSREGLRSLLQETLAELNGRPGDPRSFDALERLLGDQAYRLSYWRVAADEVNYRRFFDINDLAAIRVEEPEVFESLHAFIFEHVAAGQVTGLRVDHPDGLLNPERYFRELRARSPRPLYVVAEKILCHGEEIPADWAIDGTTGYDFLNVVNGLFVAPGGRAALLELDARLAGSPWAFGALVHNAKRLVLATSMSSELHMLARRLDRISEQHRWSRDFTHQTLREALAEVIACFPVYRTYTDEGDSPVEERDRAHILRAVWTAKRRNPAVSATIYEFVASVLLLEHPEGLTDEQLEERRAFVLRFQQLTGPVMAKGVEDTSFYRRYPLASLNEVGGEPEAFGVSLQELHGWCAKRLARWPHSLSASTTHDTKRSEDARLRIDVISEMAKEWATAVADWSALNQGKKTLVHGAEAPDSNEEHLVYQTLVAIWPLPLEDEQLPCRAILEDRVRADLLARLEAYMEKALKEAKVHTSWIDPDPEYDTAVKAFCRGILDPESSARFFESFARVEGRIQRAGAVNSLSQTLLKATLPGVPDIYQGTELWDTSLVDPDNRRPVDFQDRVSRLAALAAAERTGAKEREAHARRLLERWARGEVKLEVLRQALGLRKERPELFREGRYIPLEVAAPAPASDVARATDLAPDPTQVLAFARVYEGAWAITIAPCRVLEKVRDDACPLPDLVTGRAWQGWAVALPPDAPRAWTDRLTGRRLDAGEAGSGPGPRVISLVEALAGLPVALLVGGGR